VQPFIDTFDWEYYDLSCKARDETEDQVLLDAVNAGKRLKAIFKEPTITPTKDQQQELGLKKAWGSPNGAMRRGWNGITISRDTIHIPGIELGYKNPVFFERHAVGGEYGAGWASVGKGRVLTTFFPEDIKEKPIVIDGRQVADEHNAVVVYDNPLDNVEDLAHIFFERCLKGNITPYVVTKKTVFKWQDGFWQKMEKVFNKYYKEKYLAAGLLDNCGGKLQHLISDAATMQIIRWKDGGFGMACHNYDGDMLTDEVAQVHRSPGFITSNLIGKADDGTLIKEFEASHGTVADLWHAHLRGEETSMNPLGMAVALMGAMDHSAALTKMNEEQVFKFTQNCREAMYQAFCDGRGTRDMAGPSGLTTEGFVDTVAEDLHKMQAGGALEPRPVHKVTKPARSLRRAFEDIDQKMMSELFEQYDVDQDGSINFKEFVDMTIHLGVAPLKASAVEKYQESEKRHAAKEDTSMTDPVHK